jgi:hypothetical protein
MWDVCVGGKEVEGWRRTLSSFMKRFRSLSTSSRSTVRARSVDCFVVTGVVRQAVGMALW